MKKYTATFKKRVADSGEKQFIYPTIGKAYENVNGHIDVILNAIPIDFDGKIRLWLDKDNENSDPAIIDNKED